MKIKAIDIESGLKAWMTYVVGTNPFTAVSLDKASVCMRLAHALDLSGGDVVLGVYEGALRFHRMSNPPTGSTAWVLVFKRIMGEWVPLGGAEHLSELVQERPALRVVKGGES